MTRRWIFVGTSVLTLLPVAAVAQEDRISGAIDRQHLVALRGNVSPKLKAAVDQGALDPTKKLSAVTLALKPSAAQQADLDRMLVEQQDPHSPNYHKWLTPERYADRFGLSRSDIGKIAAWLESESLHVDQVARGRNWIMFHGTVSQIEGAFHTQIHRYEVDGESHFANATEPMLPAAIAPLVTSIRGLNDFHPKPPGPVKPRAGMQPRFTDNAGNNFLAPDDLATIYDIGPLYQAGFDGTGQKLVVAGQTKVNLVDITNFRSTFGIGGNPPAEVLVPGSVDPGVTGDLGEADLDLEWSGAVARGADVIYVYSSDVVTSVQYAVDQNLAPIISFSYGHCELSLSGTDAQAAQQIAQQANAQGISWLVSTGDSGAAGCDRQGQNPLAQNGVSANIFASIPEVTGVGGTQFDDGGGQYWSGTNSPTKASALGYIPEIAWNESGPGGLGSTGGGYSIFYPRPAWQTGPGVRNINARSSPDVALTAATHDGYLVFTDGNVIPTGGTSASTPSFAGIIAILNQYQVDKGFQAAPGQGNLNPNIYRMAQSTSDVFHDIVSGDNIVPCSVGTTDCTTGSYGYSTGPGYDPVTGWGSVDATNLVTEWNTQVVNTTTLVSASPSNLNLNGSTRVSATVSAIGSGAVPDGTVAFNFGTVPLGAARLSGGVAAITVYGSQLTEGSDTIQASYSGSASFSGSSGATTVNVGVPSGNSAVVPSIDPNPVFEQQPDADGYSWFYTVTLTEVAGTATTLTGFSIDGNDYTDQIQDFFGSSQIPAFGTLSAPLRTKGLTVPVDRVYIFRGMDPSGQQWTQQLSAPFFGNQITASMLLTSFPDTVRQDPTQPQNCQWPQYLGLEERNGHSVRITKFLTGSQFGTQDLSDRILEFFPSKTLPALGTLVGSICWSGVTVPQTKTFEIDGVDDTGTTIITKGTADFEASANGGALSTSADSLNESVPGSEQATDDSIDVNIGAGQQWTVTVFPNNRKTMWLKGLFPLSGAGPTTVAFSADSTGLANGTYNATLVFQSNDTQPQFVPVPITFVVGGPQGTPSIGAVVNGASFKGGAVVPGEIATIFGSNLTGSNGINLASGLPLPIDFQNVQVTVDDAPAPIFAVDNVNGQEQINFQVPFEVAGEQTANIAVVTNGVVSTAVPVVVAAQPGIFNYGAGGQIFGAILHSNFQLADTNHPVRAGETVLIYCTGLGPVKFPPADGAPADGQATTSKPTVTIGGANASVSFSGLAPNFVGLYQINAKVPGGVHGNQPVKVVIDGATSNTVLLPVR